MVYSRRTVLGMAAASLTGLALAPGMRAFAQDGTMLEGDTLATRSGELIIHPVNHASLVLGGAGPVIYADPVGEPALYEGLPPADLILITHEHGDHYSPDTLGALAGDNTRMIANPAVYGMLASELQDKTTEMANGDSSEMAGISIDAIPAYNTTEDRLQYHPEGRDNGYILTIDGTRVYVAGDTEDIPEMRDLTDIALAFLPMNLPYTMDIEQAASAVEAFAPGVVYPYHYRGSDVEAFKQMVESGASGSEVRLAGWYSDSDGSG